MMLKLFNFFHLKVGWWVDMGKQVSVDERF